MSYIGTEKTQKEGELFSDPQKKEYSIACVTGDFNKSLGYGISFRPLEVFANEFDHDEPTYLSSARADFRMFKTVDAAVALLERKGVSEATLYFDPR